MRSWARGIPVLLAAAAAFLLFRSHEGIAPEGPSPPTSPAADAPTLHAAPAAPASRAHPLPPPQTDPETHADLAGTVRDAAGAPVARAHVTLLLAEPGGAVSRGTVRTDAEGRYRIPLAFLARLSAPARASVSALVAAWHADHGQARAALPQPLPADGLTQDVTLQRGRVLRGRVLGPSGEAAPEATLRLLVGAPGTDPIHLGDSEADGRFALLLPEAPAGARIVAWHPRWGHAVRDLPAPAAPADLGDVRLEPLPTIRGRTLLSDATPAAGLEVAARWIGAAHGDGGPLTAALGRPRAYATVRSDETGAFVLAVPAGSRWSLAAPGTKGVEAEAGEQDVRIVLGGTRVRVAVRDPSGTPLPGATLVGVGWKPEETNLFEEFRAGRIDLATARERAEWFSAGSAGSSDDFVLAPGSHVAFVANLEGLRPGEVALTVPAGRSEIPVDLVISEVQSRGRLRLRCLLPTGEEAPAALVDAETLLGAGVFRGVVDLPDGLPALPVGSLHLAVTPTLPGIEPHVHEAETWSLPAARRVEVVAEETREVTFRHASGGRIRLLLRPPPGAPPAPGPKDEGFWDGPAVRLVHLESAVARRPMFVHTEDESGRARSSGSVALVGTPCRSATLFPPGRYRLDVARPGSGWQDVYAAREVVIDAGRFTEVEIDLPP